MYNVIVGQKKKILEVLKVRGQKEMNVIREYNHLSYAMIIYGEILVLEEQEGIKIITDKSDNEQIKMLYKIEEQLSDSFYDFDSMVNYFIQSEILK